MLEKSDLEALEARLQSLEKRVHGLTPGSRATPAPEESVAWVLERLTKDCGNALSTRERISPLLRRIAELETYLDPACFAEEADLSPEVKASLVLSYDSELRATGALWDRLKTAQAHSLDGDGAALFSGQSLKDLQPQLARLARTQLDQEASVREIGDDTVRAITQYNDIMESVTSYFLNYNHTLDQLEKK